MPVGLVSSADDGLHRRALAQGSSVPGQADGLQPNELSGAGAFQVVEDQLLARVGQETDYAIIAAAHRG